MPVAKLTAKAVEKLAAPDPSGKQVPHWDTELKGFGVLCSGVSNSKTYIAQRVLPDGRTRRVTVGAVSEIALDKARQRAADALDDLRRGVDPKRKVENPTLRQMMADYLSARKDLRPASIRVYRTCVDRYLKPWLDLPMRSITFVMVEERHRAVAAEVADEKHGRKGEFAANLAMRTFRVLWNFAADRVPDLPPNPVRRLRRQWYAEPRRERIVRSAEMPKFFDAVGGLDDQVARDFLLVVLFTGLRMGEAASLTWADIDLPMRVIRVPMSRTKAGRKLDLPMSGFVHDLLVARRALGDAKFVFPGNGKRGHITTARYALDAVADASGIKVSAHDLRRTYMTIAESADISPMALKALVNHSLGGGVTEGYVQMTVERLREPAQRVCDKMKELCGVLPVAGDNVEKLSA
jgi:integrase